MKIKTRNVLTAFLFTLLLAVFALLIVVVPKGATTASAATNTSAEMLTVGKRERSDGTIIGNGSHEYYNIVMYSANKSGSGTLEDYAILDWTYITFKINVIDIRAHYRFVISKDGVAVEVINLSGNSSMILYEGSLEDGDYDFLYYGAGNYQDSASILCYYRFHFTIDTTAPENKLEANNQNIANGSQTPYSITYSATDVHLSRLYYKAPNATSYSSTTNSTYVVESKESNSGLWSFYAVDSIGNKSETVQVNLDCVAPKMTISKNMSFGTTVGEAITVTATDKISTAKLYVKFEGEEWFSTGSSYTILETERNGRYYFYAEDGNGNRSETSWIILSTEEPSGSLIKSETDNSMSFVWNNEYWSATLDGSNYVEGRTISDEGQHEIVLSNNAYKTKKYMFKIEHYYKVISQAAATCLENGVIKYECSQCGNTYEETQYSGGHNFNIISTPASCTDSEQIVYSCSRCGERYETEGNYPTGHSYVIIISKEPTCTEEGIRVNTCEKCGDSYETVIVAIGHNYSISDIQTSKGKTTRVYTCLTCGHSFKQELGDQYEEVSNYVEYLFNQYSPYMWWVLLASAGVWSIVMGVYYAIAQKNEDKEKSKKMIVNYVIGLVVIAVIVVACPFLIRGIVALVT